MKITLKRLLKLISPFLMFSLCAILMGGSSIAKGMIEDSKLNYPSNINYRDIEIAEILSVLENRLGSPIVTEKVKDKVLKLSDKQIRLIASLAERIADDGQAAGAEIGLFVITILIIVS